MQGYGEVKTTALNIDDLLSVAQQRRDRKETGRIGDRAKRQGQGHFSLTVAILVTLVIALGVMVTVLKAEVASLKSDLYDLKDVKAQIAALSAKPELRSVETKLERKITESIREQERIKADVARITASMEALKAPKAVKGKKKSR